tara:strand:- start:1391 stop:3622 length:2232 start_codon:yes stop_codon:yes gene_type:complete
MKILLVVPRYSSIWGEFYQFPLGLGYIAAAMKKAGHTVTGLNLNHHRGDVETILASKIAEFDPDVCATGALSVFIDLVRTIFETSRRAKPNIINIGGGGVVGGEPGVILDTIDADIGVVGEGEATIVELLDCLEKSKDLNAVKGIVFRNQFGETIETPERPQIMELGEIAWPDYDVLECEDNVSSQRALDNYFFHSRVDSRPRTIDMITSRSCPFKCTFCFHPTGKTYRERPLDDFFAELDTLVARYNINMVGIIDELFSLEKKRLLEFCERIKPYNVQWLVQLHVNSATDETLRAMRESGCSYISYGIESMSQPVLDSMEKKSKTHRIDKALELTVKNTIGIQGNLLFGDSAATLETENESMHWWAKNRPYMVNLTPLTVFPGSPDYLAALKSGLIQDSERSRYIQNIPAIFNISQMNDRNFEMMGFQVWVFEHSLLNVAPLTSFEPSEEQTNERGTTYDIKFECPTCKHENDYLDVILPPGNTPYQMLTCRKCLTRWDVKSEITEQPNSNVDKSIGHGTDTAEYKAIDIDNMGNGVPFLKKLKGYIRKETITFKNGKPIREIIGDVVKRGRKFTIAKLWAIKYSTAGKGNSTAREFLIKKLWGKLFAQKSLDNQNYNQNDNQTGSKPLLTLPPEDMLKGCGAALVESPFDAERHNDYADVLRQIGAFGAARLHYDQALALMPENNRASIGLSMIDHPQITEQQRSKYFISWSDDPPPARKDAPCTNGNQSEVDDPVVLAAK